MPSLVYSILLTASSLVCLVNGAGTCWLQKSFSSYQDNHVYSVADAKKDFPNAVGPFKMIEGGANGGSSNTKVDGGALRGFFPKGGILGHSTGFTWYSKASIEADEAWMSYKVKFSLGFDWQKGGKLPGLCGGEGKGTVCPTGCSSVGKDRGFSTRLMWRENGGIVTYAYYPDKPVSIRCGEDWFWNAKLETGKWHHIKMWLKLNTVSGGKANQDGQFKAWLDGKQVLDKTGIRYRYNESFKVSRTYITTYAGGSVVEGFAPRQDQYIWFDEFESGSGDGSSCEGSFPPDAPVAPPASAPAVDEESQTAPSELPGGYTLVNGKAGYDVPGTLASFKVPRGQDFNSKLRYCVGKCKNLSGCSGFTLYGTSCYMKDRASASKAAEFKGDGAAGGRWYYTAGGDAVADQSGPSGAYPGGAVGDPISTDGAVADQSSPPGNSTSNTPAGQVRAAVSMNGTEVQDQSGPFERQPSSLVPRNGASRGGLVDQAGPAAEFSSKPSTSNATADGVLDQSGGPSASSAGGFELRNGPPRGGLADQATSEADFERRASSGAAENNRGEVADQSGSSRDTEKSTYGNGGEVADQSGPSPDDTKASAYSELRNGGSSSSERIAQAAAEEAFDEEKEAAMSGGVLDQSGGGAEKARGYGGEERNGADRSSERTAQAAAEEAFKTGQDSEVADQSGPLGSSAAGEQYGEERNGSGHDAELAAQVAAQEEFEQEQDGEVADQSGPPGDADEGQGSNRYGEERNSADHRGELTAQASAEKQFNKEKKDGEVADQSGGQTMDVDGGSQYSEERNRGDHRDERAAQSAAEEQFDALSGAAVDDSEDDVADQSGPSTHMPWEDRTDSAYSTSEGPLSAGDAPGPANEFDIKRARTGIDEVRGNARRDARSKRRTRHERHGAWHRGSRKQRAPRVSTHGLPGDQRADAPQGDGIGAWGPFEGPTTAVEVSVTADGTSPIGVADEGQGGDVGAPGPPAGPTAAEGSPVPADTQSSPDITDSAQGDDIEAQGPAEEPTLADASATTGVAPSQSYTADTAPADRGTLWPTTGPVSAVDTSVTAVTPSFSPSTEETPGSGTLPMIDPVTTASGTEPEPVVAPGPLEPGSHTNTNVSFQVFQQWQGGACARLVLPQEAACNTLVLTYTQEVVGHQMKYWGMELAMDEAIDTSGGFMEFSVTGEDLGFCAHWTELQPQPSLQQINDRVKWQLVCPPA